jgi:hypothetical protein
LTHPHWISRATSDAALSWKLLFGRVVKAVIGQRYLSVRTQAQTVPISPLMKAEGLTPWNFPSKFQRSTMLDAMLKRSRILGFQTIASLAQRRANRRSVGVVESVSILRGSNAWRYYFTIKEAAELGELWFINDPDGGLIEFQKDGKWILPFWPHEDVAKVAGRQMNLVGETHPMPLDHWIDQVLDVDCRQADCLVALCPSDWYAEIKTVDEVFADLAAYRKDPKSYWDQHFSQDHVFLTQNVKSGPKRKLP